MDRRTDTVLTVMQTETEILKQLTSTVGHAQSLQQSQQKEDL